jgi:hypothetical protein
VLPLPLPLPLLLLLLHLLLILFVLSFVSFYFFCFIILLILPSHRVHSRVLGGLQPAAWRPRGVDSPHSTGNTGLVSHRLGRRPSAGGSSLRAERVCFSVAVRVLVQPPPQVQTLVTREAHDTRLKWIADLANLERDREAEEAKAQAYSALQSEKLAEAVSGQAARRGAIMDLRRMEVAATLREKELDAEAERTLPSPSPSAVLAAA